MWEAVIAAGAASGIMPYGTEAMSTLRIEKGHVVIGAEADGRTTADDLGMGKLVNAGKWCIGKPLLARPGLTARDRWQLVGLTAHRRQRCRAPPRSSPIPIAPRPIRCGPRDVVVLESESRRVDRAGARRQRPRAARRDAVGGVAARRSAGRVRSARRASSIPTESGCVAESPPSIGSTAPGHYGAGDARLALAELTIAAAWNVQGDPARGRRSPTKRRRCWACACRSRRTR